MPKNRFTPVKPNLLLVSASLLTPPRTRNRLAIARLEPVIRSKNDCMVKIRQNKAAFNNDVPFGAIGFTYITVVIIFSFVITANYCNLISVQFKLIIFFYAVLSSAQISMQKHRTPTKPAITLSGHLRSFPLASFTALTTHHVILFQPPYSIAFK